MYLELGSHRFDVTHRAVVMGCVTYPLQQPQRAVDWRQVMAMRLSRADGMAAAGVDVLHVGGAPADGAEVMTEAAEQERLVALVVAMRHRFAMPLSICTARASVAAACFDAGADVVDDHSGFSEPALLAACVASGASVVASRHVPTPPVRPADMPRLNADDEASGRLEELARLAMEAGVPPERVMVDPTGGWPATSAMSARTWETSQRLAAAGLRVVVSAPDVDHEMGSTRAEPSGADDRTGAGRIVPRGESDVATVALGLARGCRVIRTHDVRVARRVAGVMAAVLEHR